MELNISPAAYTEADTKRLILSGWGSFPADQTKAIGTARRPRKYLCRSHAERQQDAS